MSEAHKCNEILKKQEPCVSVFSKIYFLQRIPECHLYRKMFERAKKRTNKMFELSLFSSCQSVEKQHKENLTSIFAQFFPFKNLLQYLERENLSLN